MSEKRSRMLKGQKSIPPLPKGPEPHPEKPPPNVPSPGEPSGGGKRGVFKCKICGKVFSSEDELQLHLKMDH
jgi:hypothetical protein